MWVPKYEGDKLEMIVPSGIFGGMVGTQFYLANDTGFKQLRIVDQKIIQSSVFFVGAGLTILSHEVLKRPKTKRFIKKTKYKIKRLFK